MKNQKIKEEIDRYGYFKMLTIEEMRNQKIKEEIDRYGHFLMTIDFLTELYGCHNEVVIKMKTTDMQSWNEWFVQNNIDKNNIQFEDKKLKKYFGQKNV